MSLAPAPLEPLTTPEPEAPPSLGRRFFNLRTLISFALGFGILVFLFTRVQIDVGAIVERVRQANPLLLIAALVAFYLTFPVSALRWRRLLGNVGFDKGHFGVLTEMIMLSWFANCIAPAKMGDAYR